MPKHLANGRSHEQFERHHRAHGVAGQADPRQAIEVADQAEAHRGAGPHANTPESLFEIQFLQDLMEEIMLADADTRRRHGQVGGRGLEQTGAQVGRVVLCNAEVHRLGAGALDECG